MSEPKFRDVISLEIMETVLSTFGKLIPTQDRNCPDLTF